MDLDTYRQEHAVEAVHWWFRGRRRLFASLIRDQRVARGARVLDVGTSSGTNLRMFRELGFTCVTGLDMSEEAKALCESKGLGPVRIGDAQALPFADRSFDFVTATDIVEHVEHDDRAVSEVFRVLVPGGLALFTVPAFGRLWGRQDEVSHHKRRYERGELESLVARAGFETVETFYFNYLLFAPILVARRALDAATALTGHKVQSENEVNTTLLNALLLRLFEADVRTARRLHPPFGVSLLVLARRPLDPT